MRWYACRYAKGADWWTLSDNVESTVIFFVIYFQFITASLVFTFGSTFRRPVYFNVLTCVSPVPSRLYGAADFVFGSNPADWPSQGVLGYLFPCHEMPMMYILHVHLHHCMFCIHSGASMYAHVCECMRIRKHTCLPKPVVCECMHARACALACVSA